MSIRDKVSSMWISHPPHATWYSSLSPSDILSDEGTASRLYRGLLEPIQFGSSEVAGISTSVLPCAMVWILLHHLLNTSRIFTSINQKFLEADVHPSSPPSKPRKIKRIQRKKSKIVFITLVPTRAPSKTCPSNN
jgi:hypothetical protein